MTQVQSRSVATFVIGACQPLADGCRICFGGEINFTVTPRFRQYLVNLIEQGPQRLVIDLANVAYMDSSAVATLIEVLQMQRRDGHKLVLCAMQSRVKNLFRIARLDKLFTIVTDPVSAENA